MLNLIAEIYYYDLKRVLLQFNLGVLLFEDNTRMQVYVSDLCKSNRLYMTFEFESLLWTIPHL